MNLKTHEKMSARKQIESKMAAIISGITGCPVDVIVLTAGKLYLSIEIEGNNTGAVSALREFFGSKFDAAEYDAELGYTYAGVNLEA